MMNYIWAGLILFAVISAGFNGRMPALSEAIVGGGQNAVTMFIRMLGMMCFWSGLVKIAEKSGLTVKISLLLSPLLKPLFPGLDMRSPAAKAIAMNVGANIMGIGNAATPLGLEAMKRLQESNGSPLVATNHMITFVVMNTASIQLIPTTAVMLRQQHGSQNPMEILAAVLISSAFSLACGLLASQLLGLFGRRKHDI